MALGVEPKLSELHKELVDKVAEGAEKWNVPGVAVAIVQGDQEDYVFHGVTSIDNPLEVNENTYFQIGSTTKTYTATAVMRLVERGDIDLQAPVKRYIPELRLKDADVAEKVTVFHLLNHTAGWLGDVFTDTGEGDDALDKYLEGLADVAQLNPLGTVASYNNAAFVLAGLIVQRVTGKLYEDAIQELVLDPLGMKESFFNPRDIMTFRFAAGHGERDDVLKVSTPWPLPRSSNPPGGIIATAADQVRYARFHLGDGTAPDGARLLSEEQLRIMQAPTAELKGGALGDYVGISWLLRDVDGTRIVAHGGSTNGQQSAFEFIPSRNFAISVFTNADKGAVMHRELIQWIHQAYLGIVEPQDEPLSLEPEQLQEFAGDYDNVNAIISISVEGDTLVLRAEYTEVGKKQVLAVLGEEPPVPEPIPVKPIAGDRYVVVEGDAKGMKGVVIRDEAGKIKAIEVGGRVAHKVR